MPRCIIANCPNFISNAGDGFSTFHIVPSDLALRAEWIRILGIDGRLVRDNACICSRHFNPEDLKNRRKRNFRLLPLQVQETAISDLFPTIRRRRTQSEGFNAATATRDAAIGTRDAPIVLDPEFSLASSNEREAINISPSKPSDNELTPEGSSSAKIRKTRNYPPFIASNAILSQDASGSGSTSANLNTSLYQYDSPPSQAFLEKLFVRGRVEQPKQDYLPPDASRNFIVNENQLRLLLSHCPRCGSKCSHIGAKNSGVDTTFYIDCKPCQQVIDWSTQPRIPSTDLRRGNLELTSAVILAGNTFEDLDNIAENANIKIMDKTTFYSYANAYLYPTIDEHFNDEHRRLLEQKKAEQDENEESSLAIAMDCRFSRPGYTATFGLVTATCLETGKILAHSVKSKTDDDISCSKEMETAGTRIILKSLICPSSTTESTSSESSSSSSLANNVDISGTPTFDLAPPVGPPDISLRVGALVTDENQSVRAMVREEFPGVLHENDPWHLTKSIMKKFNTAAKKTENAPLALWIPSIRNWIWTIMKECDGCDELLIENWRSMMYHIIGIHEWPDDQSFSLVHGCSHMDLTNKDIAYLSPTSRAYATFCSIVEDKKLHTRLRRCTLFLQTSLSESFYSLLCKYLQKRLKFGAVGLECRTKLAILDWNENVDRPILKDEKGKTKLHFHHPASAARWRARCVRATRTKNFVSTLMRKLEIFSIEKWKAGKRITNSKSLPTHRPLVSGYEPLDRERVASLVNRDMV